MAGGSVAPASLVPAVDPAAGGCPICKAHAKWVKAHTPQGLLQQQELKEQQRELKEHEQQQRELTEQEQRELRGQQQQEREQWLQEQWAKWEQQEQQQRA